MVHPHPPIAELPLLGSVASSVPFAPRFFSELVACEDLALVKWCIPIIPLDNHKDIYPLVNVNKKRWEINISNGKTHYKWSHVQ